MDGTELDAGYWYANVRQTVRFADAVRALAADGHRVFVEVSPHPVLEAAVDGHDRGPVPGLVRVIAGRCDRDCGGRGQLLAGRWPGASRAGCGWTGRPCWRRAAGGPADLRVPASAVLAGGASRRFVPAGGDGAGTAGEARFWAAVEGGDLQALAEHAGRSTASGWNRGRCPRWRRGGGGSWTGR